MNLQREHFRATILYDFKLQLKPEELFGSLRKAFKDKSFSKATVYRCFNEFKSINSEWYVTKPLTEVFIALGRKSAGTGGPDRFPLLRQHDRVLCAYTWDILDSTSRILRDRAAEEPARLPRNYICIPLRGADSFILPLLKGRACGPLPGACPRKKRITNLCHKPHNTDVAFGRRRRRTPLTQIVNQISAATFELVKPVINSGKRWSFIIKSQTNRVIPTQWLANTAGAAASAAFYTTLRSIPTLALKTCNNGPLQSKERNRESYGIKEGNAMERRFTLQYGSFNTTFSRWTRKNSIPGRGHSTAAVLDINRASEIAAIGDRRRINKSSFRP
ncbi:hypothetical protein EVAR_60615_1 [Eumeta japonica]|uniref:Mos1 transposase HTH domain-containing protein n=1 Tax=Eumeta variegata TaxID=151549 RepID=A0A4C1YAP0_EUMVA|nr:hypothetical protein EVAR_60615_1 [Eumeta japonica]